MIICFRMEVAHPLMLRVIAAAKKKNDQIDASKIADCLRCAFCRNATWHWTLRYRYRLVRQMVQMNVLIWQNAIEYMFSHKDQTMSVA
jgi:hypothetical protein